MKAKLLKRIRKEYYIAITEKRFIEANQTYVSHYFYQYTYAHKKEKIYGTVRYFDELIDRVYDFNESIFLFQERKNRRISRSKTRRATEEYNETLLKLNVPISHSK